MAIATQRNGRQHSIGGAWGVGQRRLPDKPVRGSPTTAFLVLCLAALALTSRRLAPVERPPDAAAAAALRASNARTAVWAMAALLIAFLGAYGPDTAFTKPHPALWRLVLGGSLSYLLLVAFLLFQTLADAQQFFRHLQPSLGVELPERAYGEDCRLLLPGGGANWQALTGALDQFVVAHLVGWWGKALFLRSSGMLWALSVLFELAELTFSHWLPNFNECWWDSWLLDVGLCNGLGIAAGMWTVRRLRRASRCNTHSSNGRCGASDAKNGGYRAGRHSGLLTMLLPCGMEEYSWRPFSSPLRFLQCAFVAGVVLLLEVDAFFLKHLLWVPASSPLNHARLTLLFLLALPALEEVYALIEGRSAGRLGPAAWLVLATAFTEALLVARFGPSEFTEPWPRRVVAGWGVAGTALVVSFLSCAVACCCTGWSQLWLRTKLKAH